MSCEAFNLTAIKEGCLIAELFRMIFHGAVYLLSIYIFDMCLQECDLISVCVSVSTSVLCLSVCLCVSVYASVCLRVCMSVCLWVFCFCYCKTPSTPCVHCVSLLPCVCMCKRVHV